MDVITFVMNGLFIDLSSMKGMVWEKNFSSTSGTTNAT
jgi:hypothetical protein